MKTICCILFALCFSASAAEVEVPRYFERNGEILSINGAGEKRADVILLTHSRRSFVEAAREKTKTESVIYAPEASRPFLENVEEHWQKWWTERFDYYGQQVTKIPLTSLPASQYLKDGDVVKWHDLEFRFISLPGYTKDGGGYVIDLPEFGKVVFTSELILKGGKVPDLYSFQNEIREAKIGNYHGYMGRLGSWLRSIRKLRDLEAKYIVPAAGEVITTAKNLDRAEKLARGIYRNYLSTNALHWYFGEDRMAAAAELVLGKDHGVKGMPFAEHVDLPDWCHHIGTTKLIVSKSGKGFVLDVGGRRSLESLFKYIKSAEVTLFDGIFITHTHNDHSAFVADAVGEFNCPVYAVNSVAKVMKNPGGWHLPGIPDKPVRDIIAVADGKQMNWEEFRFTFYEFPGQMLNHGALLVEKEGDDPVFFIGDSFSPSGIDDYCLMNRNLLHEDAGYAKCFSIVESLDPGTWLVNQHINHRFRFNDEEWNFLKRSYAERKKLVSQFTVWDDPNYAVDEQWAAFEPYGQEAAPGDSISVDFVIWNHSPNQRKFEVKLNGNPHVKGESDTKKISLPGGQQGRVSFDLHISESAPEMVLLFTADVLCEFVLKYWVEGMINIR